MRAVLALSATNQNRRWNLSIWVGFLLAVAGFLSYPFFTQFPATRDVPCVNFALIAAGLALLVMGLTRAFGQPEIYRGKIFGPILAVLSFLVAGLFGYVVFFELRDLPASSGAPRVGQKAPEFTLTDQDDRQVSLSDLLSSPAADASTAKPNAVLLIFYRGFW
ncbi:MAG TPA: hypothetical protein VEU75_00490 [Candidatus Acidoferrum sp.]|nr:hypothetical protein [Candidatus Acidoferrum sp.]